jgi:hypothetical protein
MSNRAAGMPDHRSHSATNSGRPSDPPTDRLASLAAITMTRQQPGLVLPVLSGVPTSYTYTHGGDTALSLARSLVTLGLGTAEMWGRLNGNLALFIRNSLNEWLRQIGAGELLGHVDFDFAIVDNLDSCGREPVVADGGKLFILLETTDNCGFITIGDQVDLLEKETPGLGRAFFAVLMKNIYSWMRVYDVRDAEEWVERWKEGIEMDMESEEHDDSGTTPSVEEYCRKNNMDLPNVEAAKPACLRTAPSILSGSDQSRSAPLLRQHQHGIYSAWIEPVLAMDAVRRPAYSPSGDLRSQIEDCWEDDPLPNWVVAFRDNDPITQGFDEESQNVYETSHAPTWLDSFDPADVSDVRRVLTYVQRFVEVNRNLVRLMKAIEKGSTNGSTNRSELDDELRAA